MLFVHVSIYLSEYYAPSEVSIIVILFWSINKSILKIY